MSTQFKGIQLLETDTQIESKEPLLKCRYVITIVGFISYFFLNAYRINMSVGIVAMVNNSALTVDKGPKSDSCPHLLFNTTNDRTNSENEFYLKTGEFDWSPAVQGHILGSYFLSYTIVQIPFGYVVERFGCKWFFFWGTVMAAVGTLGIPLASKLHAYALIALQLLRGIGQAFYQPAAAILAANWFPKTERGLLYIIMQTGASLGTVLSSVFSGLLCKSTQLGGWASSFYAFGIAGLILSAVILYFVHESPSVHPKITRAELKYILSNQENILSKRRPKRPWSKIYRCVPVYALAIGCFGQLWGISQFLIVHSTFLGTILHYPIEQNGYLSAVPFLLMFLFAQISGWLSSFLTTKKYASVDRVRKFWNLIACLGYSACLLGVYFSGCDRFWNIVFSSLSVGFTGFGQSGVWVAPTDMSPTFAASVQAIVCTFALSSCFILPLVIGYLTNGMQTIEQWHKAFFISIGIVMASGVIFTVFGSAKIQPWNYVEDAPKRDENKDTRF